MTVGIFSNVVILFILKCKSRGKHLVMTIKYTLEDVGGCGHEVVAAFVPKCYGNGGRKHRGGMHGGQPRPLVVERPYYVLHKSYATLQHVRT